MQLRPSDKTVIAERFKSARAESDLTQSELAQIIGVCRQSVSRIENCRALANRSTWEKFCNPKSIPNEAEIGHLPEHYWRDRLQELED